MSERVATATWRISPELVLALDERCGTPVDSYVNGSQTWLVDAGPGGETLELRLHPVGGYRKPAGLSHYDLWEQVVAALSAGTDQGALPLGEEVRELDSLWDGLECFEAYTADLEPATLATAATASLGVAPDHAGMVDHRAVGDAWERSEGRLSLLALVEEQLSEPA